jgi:hypothetical protein
MITKKINTSLHLPPFLPLFSLGYSLWYVLGMPLWCFVASQGKFGMDQRLNNSSQESNYVNVGENMKVDTNISSRYEMPKPTPWDFVVAILFVVYGTMALFGGLAFELYAEIKGVEHV